MKANHKVIEKANKIFTEQKLDFAYTRIEKVKIMI